MDLTKVNPILGYEMYTRKDKMKMAQRSAYGIDIPVRKPLKDDNHYV